MLPTTVPLPPGSICGYTVHGSLSPSTFLAFADSGRKVVLKPLDADCLLHGQLHPSIKERLARVRELAFKTAANLHGVERDSHGVFLVWEFIEGESLEVRAPAMSHVQLTQIMREVVLSVEALHQIGIVHGAIHARNVIVDSAGRPRLTHISPLLFHDSAVDAAAVHSMLLKLSDSHSHIDSKLRSELAESGSLRQLASRLVTVDGRPSEFVAVDAEDRTLRRRTVLAALAVAVVGILLAAIAVAVSIRLKPA
jgi:serine/threonine protein kinase